MCTPSDPANSLGADSQITLLSSIFRYPLSVLLSRLQRTALITSLIFHIDHCTAASNVIRVRTSSRRNHILLFCPVRAFMKTRPLNNKQNDMTTIQKEPKQTQIYTVSGENSCITSQQCLPCTKREQSPLHCALLQLTSRQRV